VAPQIVLLRGVNLGARNRIAMPELRDALSEGGFDDVRTLLQSGNVVLSTKTKPERTAHTCKRLIANRFGLDIEPVVRTRAELARVVNRNPLEKVAVDPKRYQVSFLAKKLAAGTVRKLEATAVEPEQVVVIGREVYAWHPRTIARSKLWALLAGRDLGVTATARNWATVTKLLALANE
jgi:uncharacterized protein (DUF1697 family)